MSTPTVGPLDEDTLRPLRTLTTLKLAAMGIVAAFALVAALLLVPQVAAGLGLAPTAQATVTAITPLPAEENVPGASCIREQVHVSWGSGNTGFFHTCAAPRDTDPGTHQDTDPSAHPGNDPSTDTAAEQAETPSAPSYAQGDVISVEAVPGWDSVVIGARWPNTLVALVILGALAASAIGALRYLRERRALRTAGRAAIAAEPLPITRTGLALAADPLSFGKGRRATVRIEFERDHRPARLQVPGTTAEAMSWRSARLYPLRATRRGRPAGPYLLELPTGGRIVAAGRALKPATGQGRQV